MLRRRKPEPLSDENIEDSSYESSSPFDRPSIVKISRIPSNSHRRGLLSMSMVQRKRSISSPRDIDEVFFQGGMDFLSDVYDDSSDSAPIIYDPPLSTPERASVQGSIPPLKEDIKENIVDGEYDEEYTSWDVAVIIFFVVITGCISSILFEFLVQVHSSAALLAALVLHLWIILTSLPNAWEYITHARIPHYWHVAIVGLSFTFILFKAYALDKLSMPVFIACSNLQLAIGLGVGTMFFGKTFSRGQYIGVLVVTAGCVLTAMPRADTAPPPDTQDTPNEISSTLMNLITGISYLFISLLAVSLMIPLGSVLVQKYEAHIQEQIFLQHLFSLPLFAARYHDLQPAILKVLSPSPYDITLGIVTIPASLGLLVGTAVFANINRYYTLELSVATNAMVSQLVNTGQKTLVLVLTMVYLYAPPYPAWYVWCGVALQTVGSLYYMSDSFSDTTESTFKPNTCRSRLARVNWDGSHIDLGLSVADMRQLRRVARVDVTGKLVRCVSDSLMPETLQRIVEEQDDYDDINPFPSRHSLSAAIPAPVQYLSSPGNRSSLSTSPPPPPSSSETPTSVEEDSLSVELTSLGGGSRLCRMRSISCDDAKVSVAQSRRLQREDS